MATPIIKDYLAFHDQYAKKYGEDRTLVLMQVGSFYESYATNERGPKLHEISNTINIICTRKDKSIVEINERNPYMMGFPMISSQKYIGILINNGYTLVVVDQVTLPPNPERKVTGIYSPSTYIENMNTHDTNYSLCIYFEEEHQKNGGNLLCAGMAAIELSTGKCYIHEAHSNSSDTKYALDETVRFITALNPSETLIYYSEKKINNQNDKIENIVSYLELGNKYVLVKNTYDKKYSKPVYQNEFLSKIYKDTGILSPIEYLGLDRLDYARLAFLLLLEFAYEHNESIINDISKPENYMDNNHMLLGNNAIYQLNIVESDIYKENMNTKYKCLFDVVNHTSTPLGRRYLKDRLVTPLINHIELEKVYNNIDEILRGQLYVKIEEHLKGVSDVERLERKMSLNILNPYEVVILQESCYEMVEIHELLGGFKIFGDVLPKGDCIAKIKKFIGSVNDTFEVGELKRASLNALSNSFFKEGIHKDIDKLKSDMALGYDFFLMTLRCIFFEEGMMRNETANLCFCGRMLFSD